MFKPLSYSIVALAVLVAGCSSGVKLRDEQAATGSQGVASSADLGQAGQSSVAGIDISTSQQPGEGPANVSHIIYFDFDSFAVRPEFQSTLQKHAEFMRNNRTRSVTLEGHTDERGGREYNLALGQKRAETVRQSLDLLGVSGAQIEAISYGKEKPAVVGYDENAYAQNRRVVIRYND